MFTVLICSSRIREACEKYISYLRPLLEGDNFAFCDWNHEADSLFEALPTLESTIRNRSEWQAIVVNDAEICGLEQINKRNPFDFVNSVKNPATFNSTDEIKEFIQQKHSAYEKALDNPILKLTNWLLGITINEKPVIPSEFQNLPDIESEDYLSDIIERRLNPLDIALAKLRCEKYDMLISRFPRDGVIFKKPKDVFVVSERLLNGDFKRTEKIEIGHDDFMYSRFYEDNLYHSKLRYLLFDIDYLMSKRNDTLYFQFLTMLLLLANNDIPNQSFRPYKVYKIEVESDDSLIRETCGAYVGKLELTLKKINSNIMTIKRHQSEALPLEDCISEEVFESDVNIPVNINSKYSKDKFYAKYSSIGLSQNCPFDEGRFWDMQYHDIKKKFIRFLREPRRAVQTASEIDLRRKSRIDDDRAMLMTGFQREDVLCRLEEEESNMVETHTNNIFDTEEYLGRMEDADKELKREINFRMTRKRTVISALIAVAAYLIGFLPFILGNLNDSESMSVSLVMTLCAIGAFCVGGFCALILMRRKLINRFIHFNLVMGGIRSEIEESLNRFSKYLSHACNVMREFSVFNFIENNETKEDKAIKILGYHLHEINEKIEDVTNIFGVYIDKNLIESLSNKLEPYNYDFSVCQRYSYDMPFRDAKNKIEFIQRGNIIEIPIDYIKSVNIEREELYD